MIARLLALLVILACPAAAQDSARIVYLGLGDDPYYEPQPVYTGVSLRDHHRPIEGVRLGLRDTRALSRALGVDFELDERIVAANEIPEAVKDARSSGPLAILLDLPPDAMTDALAGAATSDLFINIRDRSDRWRGADCVPSLLHTPPSHAMLSDALAQYLKAMGWDTVLLLHAQTVADAERAEAARRSIAKFGLKIADDRVFEPSNDPRRRDRNNIVLLTGGVRYDVVWLVDSEGDFGRYVPFATYASRPVVGTEGLSPLAWHWTFERYGAPQLNQRFRRAAGRNMTSDDWAAWVAVRIVSEAVAWTGSTDPATVHQALRSPDLSVDLYKGVRGNFRDWDGQLRQPVLLATHNAVISVAPIDGFEHRTDALDTLGTDRPNSTCQMLSGLR